MFTEARVSNTELHIPAIHLMVHLGLGSEERSQAQPIQIELQLKFSSAPSACINDSIEDTICYAELSDFIEDYCQQREFKLVEHLAFSVFEQIKKKYSRPMQLRVGIHKINPPVAAIRGGIHFYCGD